LFQQQPNIGILKSAKPAPKLMHEAAANYLGVNEPTVLARSDMIPEVMGCSTGLIEVKLQTKSSIVTTLLNHQQRHVVR